MHPCRRRPPPPRSEQFEQLQIEARNGLQQGGVDAEDEGHRTAADTRHHVGSPHGQATQQHVSTRQRGLRRRSYGHREGAVGD